MSSCLKVDLIFFVVVDAEQKSNMLTPPKLFYSIVVKAMVPGSVCYRFKSAFIQILTNNQNQKRNVWIFFFLKRCSGVRWLVFG